MKFFLRVLILFFLFLQLNTHAQPCTNTEEYFRKRHQIDRMTYGHPYTIFDRHIESQIG
jgi:hypothetical protein